jgi:hypothetical protein
MSSSSPPLIWYLLLDSTTGLPYKGTTADKVFLPSQADVADFRDAVKAKNSHKLSSKDAADILVYKNKTSFDKRNLDVEKEEPLEEDSLVDGLGKSKKEALIVLVPSTESFDYLSCGIPFFKNLCDAYEDNEWIMFQDSIPSTTLKNLYVRECYRTIQSTIAPGVNKAIITGTPGIGKSLFLIYLLWKLVKERKRVLFIYHPVTIYYNEQGDVFELPCLPSVVDHAFWNSDLWCLFDTKDKKQQDISLFPYEWCTFILSTSPRREMINDFKKPPVPQIFYMPIWTETELESIEPLFLNSNGWRERFKILGGIPRYVLEIQTQNPTQILESACTDCSLDDCIKKIGLNSTITEKSKVIHSLIHITSTYPFTNPSVFYASPTALNIIVKNKGYEAKQRIREFLTGSEGNVLIAALCGYIFEPYAIELLEKGGTFTCRQLVSGNKRTKPNEMILEIPSSIKIVVDKVSFDQKFYQLYVPKTMNYTAIDAWIPGIGAFQMTVGKKHDIKSGITNDLAMLGEANRLYWLLPPLYYHSFTKKTPQNIDQYAVLIPYPE